MQYLKLCIKLIIFLPLASAIVVGLFGNIIKKKWVNIISISFMFIATILSTFVFFGFLYGKMRPINTTLYVWGSSGVLNLSVGFLIDKLSTLMLMAVTFISFVVHVYSTGYMQKDAGYNRFFSYLSLFTFAMLMLVIANNFLQLFFGWEICGLLSYLLIGFWFKRTSAVNAGMKAFLINRVADIAFILGIGAIYVYFGSLEYKHVFANVHYMSSIGREISLFLSPSVSVISFICICLFIGAMGKSAQVPLHVWLPDSMEGPTPISALIHAATMVGAGVFLVARMSPLFEYSDAALNFILIIGSVTCLFMGLLSVIQNDIKRIIAYSTLSQLGYMMIAAGSSLYTLAIFHLFTHGFIKALLFLGAGSVIIGMYKEQDIRKMGNLKKYMPITFVTMLIASFSLVGFPSLSGFFSKDLIIQGLYHSNLAFAPIAHFVAVVGVFITALYTFRLIFIVFYNKEKMDDYKKENLKESPLVIWVSLIVLLIPSIFVGGFFYNNILDGELLNGVKILSSHSAFATLNAYKVNVFEFILKGFVSIEFLLVLLGIITSWLCYVKYTDLPEKIIKKIKPVYFVLSKKYWVDYLYQKYIVSFVKEVGWFFWVYIDKWFINGICVHGVSTTVTKVSIVVRKMQTGYLYHYVLFMIISLFAFLAWLILF